MKHKFDSRGHYNTFTRWLDQVDDILIAKAGIMTDDIPSYNFFADFQHNEQPYNTAVQSLGDHIKQSRAMLTRSQS